MSAIPLCGTLSCQNRPQNTYILLVKLCSTSNNVISSMVVVVGVATDFYTSTTIIC